MNRVARVFLACCAAILTGCHADMTYRVDVRNDRVAVATIREVMDPEFFQLAMQSNGNLATPPEATWKIERSIDGAGNHVILMTSPEMPIARAVAGISGVTKVAGKGPSIAFSPKVRDGFFTSDVDLQGNIPALIRPDANNPYSGVGMAMASSIVGIHFELRAPGQVTATNGEMTPDGFAHWDLNLRTPTHIQYAVKVTKWTNIIAASGAAVFILAGAILLLARRRQLGA